ncbi:hypothetical protein GQ53DRAFT_201130 [Thozetella sp. PMI_491]|nr:hypothetical protein GQ53DRAFT_201130 [Thozetella sp. PMI_491]
MDDLSRSEYPAMLANLQPGQAVQALSDRVKRIAKINQEIADWLQERRKVEELYVNGLRKLLVFKVPNASSDLGVFQAPWDKVLQSTDAIAASHQLFAQRIEKDVEHSLRGFQNKREMQNIHTISANLQTMARELEDAQDKADRLSKKGVKANAQKVDQANTKLESSTQQWESQAPFIFETLQALDEQRINHLRDVLTQLETHEVDQATRTQAAAEDAVNFMLEISTAAEIQNFANKTTMGKPKIERRGGSVTGNVSRQASVTAGSTLAPQSDSGNADDASEHSGPRDISVEPSRLRSRIGTMLGRRRQSIHGGFGQLSPQKTLGPFTRNIATSHGRTISPRASSHNLAESHNRLSSLAESPVADLGESKENAKPSHEGTNGVKAEDSSKEGAPEGATSILNGSPEDIFDAPSSAAPAASQSKEEPVKDADGFTVPPAYNDPISEAEREAAGDEAEQLFRVDIKSEPIAEEDQDAKQAALSNVANTLTQMGMPSRKAGTIRGRRDVRNTIYMPAPTVPELTSENPFPPSPSLPSLLARPQTAIAALASETSHASDTQSVRSGTSLGGASLSSITHFKHPDMHAAGYGPGLHASIIETVSATFEEGVVKSAKVNGEIAFAYNPDPDSSNPDHETIRLNRFPNLDAIGPNRVFVGNTPSPDEFNLDLSHLSVTSPAFTYRVHAEAESTLAQHCPLSVHPIWKPQGDKLGLLLQYRLNPDSVFPKPVTLSNVVFVARYEGRASGVQTKPSGTHLKEKHLIYWRLGDITLTDSYAKIICRIVGEQHHEPQPGQVEVRWDYSPPSTAEDIGSGISVSRLVEGKGKEKATDDAEEEDPFADDRGPQSPPLKDGRTWADVSLARKLVSGKYEAK